MATPYNIGLYALVQHQGNYLLVRQVHSSLPPGAYGLPGALLVGEVGQNVAELHLRRKLLTQLGLSVSELTLAGSHTLRTSDGGVLLNLIFGTDYNSGVPNPQQGVILDMEWCSAPDLLARPDVPEWLLSCLRTYQDHLNLESAGRAPGRGLLRWGR